jgi:type II secretory pathway component PulM
VSIAASIVAFWRERSGRERAVLLVAATLTLAAALYAFLWEPGLAARKSLAAALPRLRAQLEDMRWQREEIAALRKETGAAARRGDPASVLRASAAQTPFAAAVERIDALPGGKVRMQAGRIPFDAWLAWVESLQRQLGIRVDACRISALDQPGLVRIDASFSSAAAPAAGSTP